MWGESKNQIWGSLDLPPDLAAALKVEAGLQASEDACIGEVFGHHKEELPLRCEGFVCGISRPQSGPP